MTPTFNMYTYNDKTNQNLAIHWLAIQWLVRKAYIEQALSLSQL